MLKPRRELEENLIQTILTSKLKSKKKIVSDIKIHLAAHHEISAGDIQGWINDPESTIEDLDIRELYLLTEQVYSKTGNTEIIPEDYFTESEIRESKQFSATLEQKENEIDFPVTIGNATVVGNSAFMVTLDIKTIDKLLSNQLLNYNFDLQREAKMTKRKDKIIISPTINQKNVKEITKHLLDGTLVPTVLVFNCATRSARNGTELIFDPKKMELTITESTKVDIVDGFHRCRAAQSALQINPELDFNFAVMITNYSTRMAQQYQAQLSKQSPISKTRIQELEANRPSDTVVSHLKVESDLKGRVSQTNRIHSINRELCTYNILADTIDEQFKMETRSETEDVAEYLSEFFNYLIGDFKEEFINNLEETRKKSLIADNNMFAGYIVLARKMRESNLKPREVVKIIKDIDFSREKWKEIGVLDEKGNIDNTDKARKIIKNYFENLDLGVNV